MSALVWEDPPQPRTGRSGNRHAQIRPNPLYVPIAADLRAHPQRWARIGQFDSRQGASTEYQRVKSGNEPAFKPADDYEFAIRTGRLYARWVGADTYRPDERDPENTR